MAACYNVREDMKNFNVRVTFFSYIRAYIIRVSDGDFTPVSKSRVLKPSLELKDISVQLQLR